MNPTRLRCTGGPLLGEVFELDPSAPIVLGREANAGASIVLPSPTVSRRHCEIRHDGDEWVIEDLKSSNGIRINKARLTRSTLKPGDLLQVGAFSFMVEGPRAAPARSHSTRSGSATGSGSTTRPSSPAPVSEEVPASALQKNSLAQWKGRAAELWAKFMQKDLKWRMLTLLILVGVLSHQMIVSPLLSEARSVLLKQAFDVGEKSARSLADLNKNVLAQKAGYLMECDSVKKSAGILEAQILDPRGRVLCPIGGSQVQSDLVEAAIDRGEARDNCRERILFGGESQCEFVRPIREWRDQTGERVMVGVARIVYEPVDAFNGMKNLQSLSWKVLILILALMGGIWLVWQRWTQKEVAALAENIHFASSGHLSGLENHATFAALTPLVQEVGRLILKSNQGVKEKSGDGTEEASFLHSLLQQVLLLEERPVMVVDKDNQLVAVSAGLTQTIPVDVSEMNRHITECVNDTHLQGELMGLLNDLSQSNEVIDRALSLADRIVQARGLPLFLKSGEYVASLLIF